MKLRTLSVAAGLLACALSSSAAPAVPRIAGEWWQVAGLPEVGDIATPRMQPVDFALWPAADGTWQLWSCIRGTKEAGRSRVLHRWEGAKLTDVNWQPKGIAMRADPRVGETPGGLQAPFVIRDGKRFHMFYGDWMNIAVQSGEDGKTFERRLGADGKTALFGGPDAINTRDPMLLKTADGWICYYSAHPDDKGVVFARQSKDLFTWGPERLVAKGGLNQANPRAAAECPFVVERSPGEFYLFITQRYGKGEHTTVYFSRDPLDFGGASGNPQIVGTLPAAAPEIIRHDGQWYIAALRSDLKGIQMARLAWE